MRIALLGTRGIPANYSGFETCVENLGERLARRGHEVTVYCRSHHVEYVGTRYKGMRLVRLPTVKNKYSDTIIHTFLSSLHALKERYDVALYFIVGNSPATWIPRIVGTRTVLNVDGLDWKREKWPTWAKRYLLATEYLATKLPHVHLTDSRVVQTYYNRRFGTKPPYIPYGSEVEPIPPGEELKRHGLDAERYILFVGRLVPENCAHHLVQAFHGLDTRMKCVVVGDAPYADDYKSELFQMKNGDERIIFTGYVFGRGYRELGTNAYVFVETSKASGTHPALIEAMALSNCVVSHDTPENVETMGGAGLTYDGSLGASSLRKVLQNLIDSPNLRSEYKEKARLHATEYYSWESVTDSYEQLFNELIRRD